MDWLKRREEPSLSMIPDGKLPDVFHLIFTNFVSGHTANTPISSSHHHRQDADLRQDMKCYRAHTTPAI